MRVLRRPQYGLGPGYWIFVALCAAVTFWISGGYMLAADKSVAVGNARTSFPLATSVQLTDLTTNLADDGGKDVLSVGSKISNRTDEMHVAPLLS